VVVTRKKHIAEGNEIGHSDVGVAGKEEIEHKEY
jgi:hypothetical protein